MKCNCWSVGLSTESYKTTSQDAPVTLDLKDYFPQLEKPKPINVDYCIAPAIEQLWSFGIETLSSCCGHNGGYTENPSIVLVRVPSESQTKRIREIISKVDDRHFILHAWKLCDF